MEKSYTDRIRKIRRLYFTVADSLINICCLNIKNNKTYPSDPSSRTLQRSNYRLLPGQEVFTVEDTQEFTVFRIFPVYPNDFGKIFS